MNNVCWIYYNFIFQFIIYSDVVLCLSNVVIVSYQDCQLHVIDKLNLSQSMLIVLS